MGGYAVSDSDGTETALEPHPAQVIALLPPRIRHYWAWFTPLRRAIPRLPAMRPDGSMIKK